MSNVGGLYLAKYDLHGRYWNPANTGRLFSAYNQAVVATALSAGLPTAYTGGLVLYNPTTSGVNLAIVAASASFEVAQGAAAIVGIGVNQSSTALAGTLTPVPVQNQLVGGSAGTGVAYSSASITLPEAPVLARVLKTLDTGAITTAPGDSGDLVDLGGSIVLPPGAYACFVTTAASAASSFIGGFVYEEIAA
jgi:hypothetical protein